MEKKKYNLLNIFFKFQVSKWIHNSQENNGILVVTTLPSGSWMESVLSSSKQSTEPTDTNSYLVIFSDDGGAGASNQSYLGKELLVLLVVCIEYGI